MTAALGTRRNAVFVLFLLPGFLLSSWVVRTPDVRDLLNVSTAEMGLVLFGLSAGSMTGIMLSGPLVARWGARRVIKVGIVLIALGAAVIGVGAGLRLPVFVALGLTLFGLGAGGWDIAVDVEGADIEEAIGNPCYRPCTASSVSARWSGP